MYLNFVQHIMIFKYLRYLRQYWNSRWHEQTCKTRRCVGIHRLGLGLGLRRGKGKQGKRGWLTSPDVPRSHSSCLPAAGNSLAVSSRCCVPTSPRGAVACSSSFRCGDLIVVCPHPSTRGGAMTWRLWPFVVL